MLYPTRNDPPTTLAVKALYTNKSLFDDTNQRIEFTRPYICLSNQTIEGFTVLGHNTTVGVWVRQLEVQAFTFLDGSNGTFSEGNGIHGTFCPWLRAEHIITVGHRPYSEQSSLMADRLLVCSDYSADHLACFSSWYGSTYLRTYEH